MLKGEFPSSLSRRRARRGAALVSLGVNAAAPVEALVVVTRTGRDQRQFRLKTKEGGEGGATGSERKPCYCYCC